MTTLTTPGQILFAEVYSNTNRSAVEADSRRESYCEAVSEYYLETAQQNDVMDWLKGCGAEVAYPRFRNTDDLSVEIVSGSMTSKVMLKANGDVAFPNGKTLSFGLFNLMFSRNKNLVAFMNIGAIGV